MTQLSFSFSTNQKYLEEDFIILPENLAAYKLLENFFAQENFSTAQLTSLILKGEDSCGKTHLLHIFAKKYRAEFLTAEEISQISPAKFQVGCFYIFDDCDKINDDELLLRLVNSASEAKAFLILSAVDLSKFTLRDLVSRLRNIHIAEIKNPGLESIEQLLVSGFARRQMKVSMLEIKSISKKIDRSYSAIARVVEEY